MRTLLSSFLHVAFVGLFGTYPALAQERCGSVEECANKIVEIATELKRENELLRKQIAALIAPGAVIAFDSKDGCPEGWDPFGDSAGKVILGAGSGWLTLESGKRVALSDRIPGKQGGAETVALSPDQMPKHDHGMLGMVDGTQLPGGNRGQFVPAGHLRRTIYGDPTSMWGEGKGEAHENMPPFVVLQYCKKRPTG